MRSGVILARLLHCDGITDHLANEISRYAHSKADEHEREVLESSRAAFVGVTNSLTDEQKMAVGKFVNIHKKASFDAGIRLGLTAHAVLHDKDLPDDDDSFNEAIYGPPKPQDLTYRIEAKRNSVWETIDTEALLTIRGDAKEFARAIAIRDKTRVRVLQSGHIVQRYDSKGRKLGGDGD